MNQLACHCLPRLDGVPAAELARLFPEPSSTAPLLALMQASGFGRFNLRSIVVYQAEVPILLLPLFESHFELSAFAKGWIKPSLKIAARCLPSIFQPRILGVGLLVGEWSEIGVDPGIDAGTVAAAWNMALATLQTLAAELKSDLVTFYNFNPRGRLAEVVFEQFHQAPCQACAGLPITFKSEEEYLSRLTKETRKGLRRKMRAAGQVRVVRSRDIAPFLDRIYQLYQATVARSPLAFGVHDRLFFEKICERVPGAEYTLYFVEAELAAFNLLIVKPEAMVDKYFCMDFKLGRQYNLYVLSWLENIRCCVARNIAFYQAGPGAEKTKMHLGATLIPGYVLFKHRRPMVDRFLAGQSAVTGKILRFLGFWPEVTTCQTAPSQENCRGRKARKHWIHDARN